MSESCVLWNYKLYKYVATNQVSPRWSTSSEDLIMNRFPSEDKTELLIVIRSSVKQQKMRH